MDRSRNSSKSVFQSLRPVVNLADLEWSAKTAVTLRDANADNTNFGEQHTAMARAKNLDEFKAAHAKFNSMPWINTISTSAEGRAWYADTSATPYLSREAIEAWLKRTETDMPTR